MTDADIRRYRIRNSEKCFRFKPDAFAAHAPRNKGIYELVTFDAAQNAKVLYVGAAFDNTIFDCLSAHASGAAEPRAADLLAAHGNLYFDYIAEWDVKTRDDAQDVYWWLVQKHRPPHNNVAGTSPSERPGTVVVIDEDGQ